jgi:hypothetical protein
MIVVVIINTIYNFTVQTFFYLKLFRVSNMCFIFLDFKIKNLELLNDLNVHMVNNKFVVAHSIYKFVDDKFFY